MSPLHKVKVKIQMSDKCKDIGKFRLRQGSKRKDMQDSLMHSISWANQEGSKEAKV